jgi:ACS family D-galactonate transporter-like MFS transporter
MNIQRSIGGARTEKVTKSRYLILGFVCMMTAVNYLGRTNIAVAAPYIQQEFNLTPAMMGIVFSAFAWTYTLMQIPSGWLLDRFGSRMVYGATMFWWSAFVGLIGLSTSYAMLVFCRLSLGVCGAPTFPANSRIVSAWFPARERGLAIGAYIGSQYIGLAFLTLPLTWMIVTFGWAYIFFVTGALGIGLAVIWYWVYREPMYFGKISPGELAYIREGGGFCDSPEGQHHPAWKEIKQLFRHRPLWGMFLGSFTTAAIAYFFITWFPSYLVKAKGLSLVEAGFYASAPFLAALAGVATGGRWSDWMLTKGYSIGTARKVPIISGLLLSCLIVAANFTDDIWLITAIMCVAFFGQNIANACGWTLLSDVAPRELTGVTSGLYNFCANIGGIVTPLVIGYIVDVTNSYQLGLAFVSALGLTGVLAYVFIIGTPYRIIIERQDAGD